MKTDRELLELAAKAAGILLSPFQCREADSLYLSDSTHWNPLADDDDRWRLAAKLKIDIHFGASYATYTSNGICGLIRWPEDAKDESYAVVRSAAEIGRAMP